MHVWASYEGINPLLSLYDNYTCPFNKGLMSKKEMNSLIGFSSKITLVFLKDPIYHSMIDY